MRYYFVFLLFGTFFCSFIPDCATENVKKSADDNRDDNGDTNDESKDESMDVPAEVEPANNITCTRRQNSQMHELREAQHKQFPFIAAVMSDHNDFVCSGTVVSNGMILTTAQCTQQAISYILLNATKAKKDDTTVSLRIIKTEKFPTFSTTDTDKDVGIIYTAKHNNSIASKIKLSNYTSTRNIVDIEVLGFGLNADVGQPKELQYIGLENRGFPIPLVDSRDIIRGYIDCVETKIPTCFKDTGGPAIFENELIGIVIKGQNECTKELSALFAINKKLTEVLPTYSFKAWLDAKIKQNEERGVVALATFPMKPSRRSDKKLLSPRTHVRYTHSAATTVGTYHFTTLNLLLTNIFVYSVAL